jgi:hypothetical protein
LGLEIRMKMLEKTQNAGYLIVKNPSNSSMGSKRFWIWLLSRFQREAIVGIDFGSTIPNAVIPKSEMVRSNQFYSEWLALVGVDSENNTIAERDGYCSFLTTINGQVKS